VDAADESRVLVKIDPQYFHPTEVELLLGDPTKARVRVAECGFDNFVKEMVEADVAMVKAGTRIDMSGL
jgi:GDPmannose 4,6-dehydratase